MKSDLARSIYHQRKRHKLSQSELADKIGVNQTAISQWERNITIPTINHLCLLSGIFNCEIYLCIRNDSIETIF